MKTQHLIAGILAIFVLSSYLLGQNGWTDDGTVVRLTTSTDKVGIGTANPNAALELGEDGTRKDMIVHGDFAIDAMDYNNRYIRFMDFGVSKYALRYFNGAEYLAFYEYRSTNANVMVIKDGNVGIRTTNPQAKLDVNGTTRTKVIEITGGADLAEPFEIAGTESIKPGMVVSIDPEQQGQLRVSSRAYDRTVAGIISGAGGVNPGILMTGSESEAVSAYPVGPHWPGLRLVGRH